MYSPEPREVLEWRVSLAEGATVADAIAASGLRVACPGIDPAHLSVGIWGRRASADQALRAEDRVEIYRELLVDPKLARRERFRKQGARATGLFAKRRPGAKPGY